MKEIVHIFIVRLHKKSQNKSLILELKRNKLDTMNITQKQRKTLEQIGVLQSSLIFIPCFLYFLCPVLYLFSPLFCVASSHFFGVLCGFSMSRLNPSFYLLYSGLFTPQLARRKFPSLLHIPFLSEYCGLHLRQKTCEFKDIYFR